MQSLIIRLEKPWEGNVKNNDILKGERRSKGSRVCVKKIRYEERARGRIM